MHVSFEPPAGEKPLAVSHLVPIGGGNHCSVYVHPDRSDLIVKVPAERQVLHHSGVGGRWYKRPFRKRSRTRHLGDFLREVQEQLVTRAAGDPPSPFMQEIVGFVETDVGHGTMSRAVRTAEGELAPTLRALLRAGKFDRRKRADLNAFFQWVLETPVVFSDLNPRNIVYGVDREGTPRFVAIDGIGEKNVIPFSSLSTRMNRRAKQRRIDRINREIAETQRRLAQEKDAAQENDAASASVAQTVPVCEGPPARSEPLPPTDAHSRHAKPGSPNDRPTAGRSIAGGVARAMRLALGRRLLRAAFRALRPRKLYEPVEIGGRLYAQKREADVRWQAISETIQRYKARNLLDIGCAEAWFLRRAAVEFGTFGIGVEAADRRALTGEIARLHDGVDRVAVIKARLGPEDIRHLPVCDIVLCLSVLHHIMREEGRAGAEDFLRAIAGRVGKALIFEMGTSQERQLGWTSVLPDMPEGQEQFIRTLLGDCGFANARVLAETPGLKGDAPRLLFAAEPA